MRIIRVSGYTWFFFFQAEDGIRDLTVTGVQTCALPIFVVQAGDQGIRFLLVSGKPIQEPIAWYGPIVMNTRQQLEQAYRELEAGTFIARERSEEHTSELQSQSNLVCRLLLEKKKQTTRQ